MNITGYADNYTLSSTDVKAPSCWTPLSRCLCIHPMSSLHQANPVFLGFALFHYFSFTPSTWSKAFPPRFFSYNFDLIKSNTFFVFHLQHSSFWTTCILYFKTCAEYPDIPHDTALFSVPACSRSARCEALSGLQAQWQATVSSMVGVYCKDTKE